MDPFKNLQDRWKEQQVANLPDLETIKTNVASMRNKLVRKNLLAIVLLSLCILVIVLILFFIDFKLATTKWAAIGVMIVVFMGILFLLRLNQQMYNADKLQHSSKAYLIELKSFKTRQQQTQYYFVSFYFVALTILLFLYLYEFYLMSATLGLFAYGSLSLWILFVWFYLRPKTIAKQEQQINNMIENVERIEAQFKE